MSSISSFEIVNDVVPYPSIFFWIAASAADIPAGSNTFLANGVSTVFSNGKTIGGRPLMNGVVVFFVPGTSALKCYKM